MKNCYEHCFDFVKQMLQVPSYRSILFRNDKQIFNALIAVLGMLAEDYIKNRLFTEDDK